MIRLQPEPANAWQRFLSNGFRPLFLVCALQALLALSVWLWLLHGGAMTFHPGWSPVDWHGHEMLFGFVGAAVGGFLLAAVAKWTGRAPISGYPLLALLVVWLLGRGLSANLIAVPTGALLLANTGYWLLLAALVGREILRAGNRRNLVVVLALGVMGGFSALFQLGWVDRLHLLQAQVLMIALLISLIGGRIIPAFTRNWLLRRNPNCTQLPAAFGGADRLAVAGSILAALAWVIYPSGYLTAALLLLAGAAQWARLARWCGMDTFSEPLLFALHLAYSWLGLGLLLLGTSLLTDAVPRSAGLHALGVGAMAGMILAVAARAALGHTNRELRAGRWMSLAFTAIHLAALLRVLAALWPAQSQGLIALAAAGWLIAFLAFTLRYLPILLGPEESLSEALQRARTQR